MKARCYDKNNKKYKNYGERGIKVSQRWHDFLTFYNDMIADFSPNLSLERIDVNKNYSIENCKWATQKEQQNNRTNNVLVTLNGKTMTLAQWAARIGIAPQTINNRIHQYGWSVEKALSTPLRKYKTKSFI